MKSTSRLGCFAGTLALFSLAWLKLGATPAEIAAPADPTEPKPISFFVGTDISIERGKKLYRILDVNGSSFVISVDGKPDLVPMRGERHNLKVEHSVKLTSTSALVTGLVGDRAYTPGNDPRMRRQIEAVRVSAAVGDNASLAMGQYMAAKNNFFSPDNSSSAAGTPAAGIVASQRAAFEANAAAAADKALEMARVAEDQLASNNANGGYAQLQAQGDLIDDRFDAVEVEFYVSSATPLTSPYMVLLVNYLEKEDQPDSARNLIHACPLNPIGTKPERVHVLQGGLPRGYALKDFQVHLYDRGEEIATDVVPKRVALTREQAFQFLQADYLRQHKGATLAAAPAIGRLDAETKARLTHEQLTGRYFVKVSSEGRPLAVFADEACTLPADEVITGLTEKVRFYPALADGKRVEGVARLVFTQLRL